MTARNSKSAARDNREYDYFNYNTAKRVRGRKSRGARNYELGIRNYELKTGTNTRTQKFSFLIRNS